MHFPNRLGTSMARDDPNPFDFASAEPIAPIRQVAENAIARHARRGSVVLFFVGGMQLVYIFLFGMHILGEIARLNQLIPFDPALDIHPLVFFSFGLGVLLGALFVGLGVWTRHDPILAPSLGLGFYVGANVFDIILLFGFNLALMPSGVLFW